jgi:hypothetical protein
MKSEKEKRISGTTVPVEEAREVSAEALAVIDELHSQSNTDDNLSKTVKRETNDSRGGRDMSFRFSPGRRAIIILL